jgi:hypothetical protein
MKLKALLKFFSYMSVEDTPDPSLPKIGELKIKVFDRHREMIGDITNITVEDHAGEYFVILNTKLEDLK